MKKDLAIADIRTDGNTQQRPLDEEVVLRYRDFIKGGKDFVAADFPVEVMFDGTTHWLYDGFHRLAAYKRLGKKYIPAEISKGTRREAEWFSFRVNHDHGFPRQKDTVKDMLLKHIFPDPEWKKFTDAALADWVGCSESHVRTCRAKYEKEKSESKESDGKVYDSAGQVVPEHLLDVFSRIDEIREHVKVLKTIYDAARDGQEANDPLWAHCKLQQLKSELGNVRRNLRFTIPYCVCFYCNADPNNKDCDACGTLGFQNEAGYLATPEDMK